MTQYPPPKVVESWNNSTPGKLTSSIPGRNSPYPSNTMPPPPTNDGNHNIYGCMVDVSKLTPEKRQQHAVMLLEHYHGLCNMNEPSSVFVSPPPIPNIESFSQSTISSIDSVFVLLFYLLGKVQTHRVEHCPFH